MAQVEYKKEDQDKIDEGRFLWSIAADLADYAKFQGISIADALDILETELVGMYEEHFHDIDKSRFLGVYRTSQKPNRTQRRITIPSNIAKGQTEFFAYRTAAGGVRYEPKGDLNG